MAVTKAYRDQIEERLGRFRPIRSRPMFGGVSIYTDDLIFAILDDDRLWFKFDDQTRSDFEAYKAEQWTIPNAPPMGYFELPKAIWESDEHLPIWIENAIGAAKRKKTSKAPKKKRSS